MNTEIADQILDLILNRFIMNKQKSIVEQIRACPDIYSVPLTGELFGMNGTELDYCFCLEKYGLYHNSDDGRS